MLATAYAGKHPTAIQGLVVADPGGLKWNDVMEYMKTSRSFNILDEFANDAAYLDQFITGKESQHEILDYKLAMLASKNEITGEVSIEPGSFWRMGAVINVAMIEAGEKYEPDFSDGISSFNVPVLFFYAEKNKAYPDSWAQKISGVFNTADLFKVMGAGHSGIFADKKVWTEITLPKTLIYFNSL